MRSIRSFFSYLATQGMGRGLHHPHYSLYLGADWFSGIGNWSYRVGWGWLTWELTHSGFWLGVVAAAGALSAMTILPLMGALADRVDRLAILRWTQSVGLIISTALAVFTFAGWINIWLLTLFVFLIGLNHTVAQPARMIMAPNLVPPEDLTAAIGLSAATHSSSRFIGPGIAGVVIAAWGVDAVFALNAITYIVFVSALLKIRLRSREERRDPMSRGIFAEMLEGMKYAADHVSLGALILLMILGAVLVRPFADLLPGFNDVIFGQGPEQLGILFAAIGGGGILGSIWIANYNRAGGLLKLTLWYLLATILLLLIFATTHWFILAVAMVVGIGFATAVFQSAGNVLIQRSVEGHMRARIMSLYALSYRAGPAFGALLMGSASTYFGLQLPVIAGALIFLCVLMWYARRRHIYFAAFDAALAGEAPAPNAAQ